MLMIGGRVGAILSVAVILFGAASVARAEEHTIQAIAPLEGRVRVFFMGPQQAFVLGVFTGRVTVEKGPNFLEAARIQCPASIDADYPAKTQRGEGRCVITTGTGDQLFARWTCMGDPDRGCFGRFTLLGGSGAYRGAAGEGEVGF